jgi:hypothetical protein
MSAITLRFVRARGWTSTAIALREQTAMPFTPSHVECVIPADWPDTTLAGRWLGQHADGGMLARPAGYDHDDVAVMSVDGVLRRCELFVEIPVTDTVAHAFYAAAIAALGEPYDLAAILGFAVPWHEHRKFHAICSAKILLLLRACDFFPWPVAVPAHLVDPRDLLLMLSTRLEIPH